MFKTQRVECYLNGFAGHGDDPEAKELKLVLHISPISYVLAYEISPYLADRLFRKNEEGEWFPVQEMPKASFASIQVQMQNITFFELPDGQLSIDKGVLVPGCAISNLRAARATAGSSAYRLEFDVVVPMDTITMDLVEKYYRTACFLSMEEIQRKIELTTEDTEETTASLQDAADDVDGKSAGAGDERPRRRGRKARTEEVPA